METTRVLGLVLIALCLRTFEAGAVEVSYATWQNGMAMARTGFAPDFNGEVLKGRHFKILDVPEKFKADENGCYCFAKDSPEFAYSHLYFYASSYFEKINTVLRSLEYPELSGIQMDISRYPEDQPSGNARGGLITLSIAHSAVDPTILAHEIGHELHFHLSGDVIGVVGKLVHEKKWVQLSSWMLLMEGTGNFISAWLNNDPRIGRFDWFEATIDINSFIRFPDLVLSVKDKWQLIADSYHFARHYPRTLRIAESELSHPKIPEINLLPDPYLSSAAVNQPLWQAMGIFGPKMIAATYMRALSGWRELNEYPDFANRLTLAADSEELRRYLFEEFRYRGLIPERRSR